MDSFFQKISDLFDKGFLIVAVLPCLFFYLITGVLIGFILGYQYLWNIIVSNQLLENALISLSLIVFVFVSSYIVFSLRSSFINFWSGKFLLPNCFPLLYKYKVNNYRKSFVKDRLIINKLNPWDSVEQDFQSILGNIVIYKDNYVTYKPLTMEKTKELESKKLSLEKKIKKISIFDYEKIKNLLKKEIVDLNLKYDDQHIEKVNEEFRVKLSDCKDGYAYYLFTLSSRYNNHFCELEAIKPTRLGNIIETYEYYPYSRYEMEAKIFWPRIKNVIDKDYFEYINEPKLFLEFHIISATLSGVFSCLCLFVFPYLWLSLFWYIIGLIALALSFLFYNQAVDSAINLGHAMRSAFDLYRFELLKKLHFKFPINSDEEIVIWKGFSRLIVYGKNQLKRGTLIYDDK